MASGRVDGFLSSPVGTVLTRGPDGRFFEAIVEHCQQARLVWGCELSFDATHVLADAAMDSLVPRFAVEARAAIHAHLDALFAEETTPQEEPQAAQDRGAHGICLSGHASPPYAAAG
jgi:hypothetical protein